jgi:hypothetical protein
MTDEMMTLRALLEKSSDADLLREMIGFTLPPCFPRLFGAGDGQPPPSPALPCLLAKPRRAMPALISTVRLSGS